MGEFQLRLASVAVHAQSPDGHIRGEVRGAGDVGIQFAPGAYLRYQESTLAHQLGQLGPLLWTRYRRAYLDELDNYLGGLADEEASSTRERDYWQELEQLTCTGVAPHQEIRVRTRGLVRWEVEVASGLLDHYREDEFLRALSTAVNAVLASYRAQVTLLTDEYFDLGLPDRARHR